jgi:hypothetical protein
MGELSEVDARAGRELPAQTKPVSKETYYRGKRDLPYADFYADLPVSPSGGPRQGPVYPSIVQHFLPKARMHIMTCIYAYIHTYIHIRIYIYIYNVR